MDEKLELWYKFEPSDVDPVTKVLTNHGNPSSDISGDAVFNVYTAADTTVADPVIADYFKAEGNVIPGAFYNPNEGNSVGKPAITLPDITMREKKEFTLSFWHKQSSFSSTYKLFYMHNSSNSRDLEVYINNNNYSVKMSGRTAHELNSDYFNENFDNNRVDGWYHHCFTNEWYDYGGPSDNYRHWVPRYYINGVLVNEIIWGSGWDIESDLTPFISPMIFETGLIGSNTNHFNGYINDFRFYTRALSPSEVRTLGYVSPNIKPTNVVSLRKQGLIKFSWDEPTDPVNQYDITYVDENTDTQTATVNTNSFSITGASDNHVYDVTVTANNSLALENADDDNIMPYLFSAGYDSSTGVITSGSIATDVTTRANARTLYKRMVNAGEFTIYYKDIVFKKNSNPGHHPLLSIPTLGVTHNGKGVGDNGNYRPILITLFKEDSSNRIMMTLTILGQDITYYIPNLYTVTNNNSYDPDSTTYPNVYDNNYKKFDIIVSFKDNIVTVIINGVSRTFSRTHTDNNGKVVPPTSILLEPTNAGDRLNLFHRNNTETPQTDTNFFNLFDSIGSVKFYTKYVDSVPGLGASASTSKTVTVPESLPTIFPPFPNRIATADNVVSLSKLSEDDLTDPAIVGSTLTAKRATSKTLIKDFMKGFKSTIGSNKLKISKNAILPGYSLARDVFVFNAAQGETDLSDSLVSEINYDDAFGKDFYVVMDNSDTITIPSHDDTVQIVKNTDNTYTLTNSLGDITKPANSIYQYNGLTLNLGSVLGHLTDIICFREGTKVLCYNEETQVEYEKTIESIKPGMYLKTYKHGYKKVELMNSREIRNPGNNERSKNRLYKLEPAQYPELKETLYLTGCHALLVDKLNEEQTTQVKDTLGEIYITDDKYRLPAMYDRKAEPFADENKHTVWHVCLEHEDQEMNYGIYVNGGLLTESCCKRNILLFNEEMKK